MLEGGYHLIIDLEGCEPRRLNSKKGILRLCRDVADLMRAPIIMAGAHHFRPRGVTAFVVIAESHISAHTWPESGKAFVDVFTCKETIDAERVIEFIFSEVGAKRGRVAIVFRSGLFSRLMFSARMPVATIEIDFGRLIHSIRSRVQHIELTKGPMGVSLFLDGYWQFVERYEHIYHEALVHPAMVCAPRLRRIGIGGGGDGLALRETLRYRQLGRVWMYELDPAVIEMARSHPEMIRLNGAALDDPRATVRVRDARSMLTPTAEFDVLVFDFPSIADGRKFGKLYSTEVYQAARRAITRDGILVTQLTDQVPNVLRTIHNLERVFQHVLPIEISCDHSAFTFVAASDRPFRQRRPLPPGLRFLTQGRLERLLGRQPLICRASRSTPVAA